MFRLTDIKEAHSRVKTGADFPAYIQDLIKLGVTKYDTFVDDGHAIFFGSNDYNIQSEPKYPALIVAEESDQEKFRNNLKMHQQGQTDYLTFCRHAAEAGVQKWRVDTNNMTCTYFDQVNHIMVEERIPG